MLDHAQNAANKRKFIRDNTYYNKLKDASDVAFRTPRANEQLILPGISSKSSRVQVRDRKVEEEVRRHWKLAKILIAVVISKQHKSPNSTKFGRKVPKGDIRVQIRGHRGVINNHHFHVSMIVYQLGCKDLGLV
jgi:hypothetical protein